MRVGGSANRRQNAREGNLYNAGGGGKVNWEETRRGRAGEGDGEPRSGNLSGLLGVRRKPHFDDQISSVCHVVGSRLEKEEKDGDRGEGT